MLLPQTISLKKEPSTIISYYYCKAVYNFMRACNMHNNNNKIIIVTIFKYVWWCRILVAYIIILLCNSFSLVCILGADWLSLLQQLQWHYPDSGIVRPRTMTQISIRITMLLWRLNLLHFAACMYWILYGCCCIIVVEAWIIFLKLWIHYKGVIKWDINEMWRIERIRLQ